MLLRVNSVGKVSGRLEGSRDNHIVDLILELAPMMKNISTRSV